MWVTERGERSEKGGVVGRVNRILPYHLCRGADISAADNNSYTPLLTAAAHGQTASFKMLRERGARLDVLDRDGKTVVFVAAEGDHVSILKVSVFVCVLVEWYLQPALWTLIVYSCAH